MVKLALITGASGLLGRAVLKEFKAAPDWEVLGLAYSRAGGDLRKVDITDKLAVNQIVSEYKPNVTIHCAAERNPDVVEKKPDATKNLNVSATDHLCQAAVANESWILYLSTDYVFDGKNAPYQVTDQPNPLNNYGKSKLEGEVITMGVSKDFAILRVPILYGEVENLGESAVTTLFDKVKDTSTTTKQSDYERRYPTHCDDVAFVIRELANKQVQDKNISGIYHWSGDENMTKYDMAVVMATQFGISTNHIESDKTPSSGAPRPYDAHLDPSRIEELGIKKRTKFAEGIKSVLSTYFP